MPKLHHSLLTLVLAGGSWPSTARRGKKTLTCYYVAHEDHWRP